MSTNTTSSWVPQNNMSSAHVGEPPNTQRDWYIVRGLLRAIKMYDADPAKGYIVAVTASQTGEDYTSKRPGVIAGLIVVLVAITTVTGSRLALRASTSHMRFGADDWATIAAAAMGLTYTVCQLIMAIVGGGDHIWHHTYEDYYIFNYYGTVDKLIFYVTVALIKTSLTLFIRRLIDRTSRGWRWLCDFFLVTLAAYILLAIFWFCFSCDPAKAQWDRLYAGELEEPATCLDTTMQGEVLNVVHVVQGVILLSSPVIILWKVKMEIKKKMRLFFIWAVGLLVVLFGLLRMLRADFTSDVTWTYTELLIWTSLDVSVGIVVISLPVLDAWLAGGWRKAMTKMGRTTNNSRGMGHSGYGNLDRSGFGTMKSHRTTGTRSAAVGSSRDYSESVEDIIDKKNGAVELTGIMRTDEYAVHYTTKEEEGHAVQQPHVAPVVDAKYTGIAR